MKKLITATFVCFTLLFSSVSNAAIDPKLKMVATMAGYGVVGGALLGTASLAFGSGGRSIAKGASLGLYAGIIFGSYIILNYEMKKRGFGAESKGNYYPESDSQYDNNDQTNIAVDISEYRLAQFESKKDPKKEPKFFMNLVHLEF
ncbi:hypothetical protein SHI21_20340 [Bacteriovorax sp. PP10]|uniref:Uncharacterized protein n=1 Tax=Bacteriovorax antarcticus TaxID=3088717 RepID=A0ABU5W1V0_9BACT|nr:hypothetical protein [Bacteriovorax sp. PP10]MEA9358598.1 hypothetical protein [Bacteriovorax sp. PP10]